MSTSLLSLYQQVRGPPPSVLAEARGWGLELKDPVHDHWDTVSDFIAGYCRDTSPAGVLVVASDPSVGGAVATGIPFTDAPRAERLLNLQVQAASASGRGGALAYADAPPGSGGDPAAERFWGILTEARRATGGSLEGLFSTVHLAHAFPYALWGGREPAALTRYLPAMPHYRQAGRAHLEGVLQHLRPQVVACVDRLAFEAVANAAENRLALAAELAERGWEGLVLSREYADGLQRFPRAEFRGFRSRLLPVGGLGEAAGSALASHAQDTLLGLLRDACA